jgi:hypothetical protein
MFFWFMVKGTPFFPASWEVRDCFALKWLKPGFRPMILPVLVNLRRFVYDLFVFALIYMYYLLFLCSITFCPVR